MTEEQGNFEELDLEEDLLDEYFEELDDEDLEDLEDLLIEGDELTNDQDLA